MQNYKRPEDFDDLSLDDQGVNSRYKLKSCLVKAGFISSIQVVTQLLFSLQLFHSYGKNGKGKQSTNELQFHLSQALV